MVWVRGGSNAGYKGSVRWVRKGLLGGLEVRKCREDSNKGSRGGLKGVREVG